MQDCLQICHSEMNVDLLTVALRSLGNENFKKRESYDKNKHSWNIVLGGAKGKLGKKNEI